MNTEKISKMEFSRKGIGRILLFQSLNQLLSYVACAAIAYLVIAGISSIAHHEIDKIRVMIACLLGSLVAVFFSLTTEFTYAGSRANEIFELIKYKVLVRNRYQVDREESGCVVMSQLLPWPLSWEENKALLKKTDENIYFKGPWIIARACHRIVSETIH